MQFEKVHNLTVCGCEAELSHWFVMSFLNHPLGCALIYNCVFFHLRENWSCIKNNLVDCESCFVDLLHLSKI